MKIHPEKHIGRMKFITCWLHFSGIFHFKIGFVETSFSYRTNYAFYCQFVPSLVSSILFPMVNISFLCSKLKLSKVQVYFPQCTSIRYFRSRVSYLHFFDRYLLITKKINNKFRLVKFKSFLLADSLSLLTIHNMTIKVVRSHTNLNLRGRLSYSVSISVVAILVLKMSKSMLSY